MGSRDCAKVLAEDSPVDGRGVLFDFFMSALPDRKCSGKEGASLVSENENSAAAVVWIVSDLYESTSLQRLESGSERCSIHSQKGSDWSHEWRLRTIERHQERELPVCEVEWAKFFVEAASESAGGTLHMQAKTTIFHHQCCLERQRLRT